MYDSLCLFMCIINYCTNLVDIVPLIFTIFLCHLLIFSKNRLVYDKIRPKITTPISGKSRRFICEIGRLIAKIGRISIFLISTIPSSSPVRFS
jgi:hypothetical protein